MSKDTKILFTSFFDFTIVHSSYSCKDKFKWKNCWNLLGEQIHTYLMSGDARDQANFYVESLCGKIQILTTFGETPGTSGAMKEKVMHLALTVAGTNTLMMADSFEPVSYNRNISIASNYDDESEARTAFAKLSKDGERKYPFAPQPWGAHDGEVVDQGHNTACILRESIVQ